MEEAVDLNRAPDSAAAAPRKKGGLASAGQALKDWLARKRAILRPIRSARPLFSRNKGRRCVTATPVTRRRGDRSALASEAADHAPWLSTRIEQFVQIRQAERPTRAQKCGFGRQ